MHPRIPATLLLLLLLPLGAAVADDEAGLLDVSRAGVLASPGVPAALDAFLPGGARPGALGWPLPEGPVVLLGLPDSDPAARSLADVFHFDVDDLAGGYRLWAWDDGHRPIVAVMAADPAALLAARFEFATEAQLGMAGPDMRSLDFKQPNEQAGCAVRSGTRTVRPRFAVRTWHPGGPPTDADAVAAGGARANRVWIDADDQDPEAAQGHIATLRAQGIAPVLYETIAGQLTEEAVPSFARAVVDSLQAWQARAGIRHFALVFDATLSSVRMEGARAPAHEHAIARAVADALRPAGLEELVVVPRCHSDRLARTIQPPPVLADIPEAYIAWSGPSELALGISRAAAQARVAAASGVPVVLLDTWAAPFQGPGHEAYVPSLPRGRAADLDEVLDGVVVVGRRGTQGTLEALWEPVEDVRFGAGLLGELLPASSAPAASQLAGMAAAAHTAAPDHRGLVPWFAPLAAELEAAARDATTHGAAVVPLVPAEVVLDGALDERSWAFALPLVRDPRGVDVLVLSDGAALRFGVRVRREVIGDTPFLFQLHLATGGRTDVHHVAFTPEGVTADTTEGGPHAARSDEPHVTWKARADARAFVAELTFDRFALGGDPHLGRTFGCTLSWGPARLWPAQDGRGVLLVGR